MIDAPPPPLDAPPVGAVVDGRFEITGVLGRGGMGVVVRARHRFTGADVAIKLLHPHLRMHGDLAARFLAEARATAAIGHPGIVAVTDAGVSAEGDPFLVMELYVGETLASRIASADLTLPEIRGIGVEVLDALGAAHAAGFVHRDLKPENVFLVRHEPPRSGPLSAAGRVRLLDFGIAKGLSTAESGYTTSGLVMGTTAYMSPEQLKNSKNVDHRTDLWAFGVVVYEMATGALPFVAEGFGEMLLRVLARPPTPLSDHLVDPPPELEAFLKRALAVDPAARFATVAEMTAALVALPDAPLRRLRPRLQAFGEVPTLPAPSAPASTGAPLSGPVIPAGLSPFPRSSARAPDAPAPPPSSPIVAGQARGWLIAGLGAAALVAGLSALVTRGLRTQRPTDAVTPVVSVSALTPGHPSPSAATDAGPATRWVREETTNETARRAFDDGMRELGRGRVNAALSGFSRAIASDPEMPSALFQRAALRFMLIYTLTPDYRREFAAAFDRRDAMSARDRALLDAITPAFGDPPDFDDAKRRLERATSTMPEDAQAWTLLAVALAKLEDEAAVPAALARAAAADPRITLPYQVWIQSLAELGDLPKAREVASQCIARDPGADYCHFELARAVGAAGGCDEMERIGREITARDPTSTPGFKVRVEAAMGHGEPEPTLRELFARRAERLPDDNRERTRQGDEIALAIYRGDFEDALGRLAAAEDPSAGIDTVARHASLRARLLVETGDLAGARVASEQFLLRAAALPRSETALGDVTGELYGYLLLGGAIDRDEHRRRVGAWIEGWRARRSREAFEFIGPSLWSSAVPLAKLTRADASEILALATAHGALHKPGRLFFRDIDYEIGEILRVAGRTDDAIAFLDAATRACPVLRVPIDVVWPPIALSLGKAYEAKGDPSGACAAYARVLAAWGRARPRSVSADDAKARVRALRCK